MQLAATWPARRDDAALLRPASSVLAAQLQRTSQLKTCHRHVFLTPLTLSGFESLRTKIRPYAAPVFCKGEIKRIPNIFKRNLNSRVSRKKLVAQRRRHARVYKGIAAASVTFCGKGGARERADDFL